MRKLLVVAATLFMTPIAGGMTVTLIPTGTSSVGLDVVGATYGPYLAMVIQAPGVLSNFRAGPAAPSTSASFGPVTIYGDSGEMWGFGVAPGEPYVDGVWLIADWSASIPVWVTADETFDSGVFWITLVQIQVPEPMTIALMGLGGLFMLRRRRHK